VTGKARTWVQWPPFQEVVFTQPLLRPWVALSDTNDQQVYTGRGNPDGTFSIAGVPAGQYTLTIWDDPLDYIIREVTIDVPASGTLDLGDVGVFRWFGWVSGHVFEDNGLDKLGTPIPRGVADNGIRDCVDYVLEISCEEGIPNSDLDIRARDGSVFSATFTNQDGYYEFAEEVSKIHLAQERVSIARCNVSCRRWPTTLTWQSSSRGQRSGTAGAPTTRTRDRTCPTRASAGSTSAVRTSPRSISAAPSSTARR
jgi:hypothetical protein